jgi:hypothetical protein
MHFIVKKHYVNKTLKIIGFYLRMSYVRVGSIADIQNVKSHFGKVNPSGYRLPNQHRNLRFLLTSPYSLRKRGG